MSWGDIDDLETKLARALDRFDWDTSDRICKSIVDRLPGEETLIPEKNTKRMLQALRRKRRFIAMGLLADAVLQSGLKTFQIRRQYGQALIDQEMLSGAELYLQALISDPETIPPERAEAHGLLGRIYKQRYVNEFGKANAVRAQSNLQRAFNEYAATYAADKEENTWHGINMVALLARAERDGIKLTGAADYKAVAREILDTLNKKEDQSIDGLQAWDVATQMEGFVATGEFENATAAADRYTTVKGADAFEFASTLRQMTEVWELTNDKRPGYSLIPILRSAQLYKEGGGLTVPLQEARHDLEKRFGAEGFSTLKWYQQGLARGKSVCRVETADGKGFGTGWLVKSTDFFPSQPLRNLVLTNAHVVSVTFSTALKPPTAWVNFQMLEKRVQVKSIVWSSPVEELDASFLDLQDELAGDPMDLFPAPVEMADPAPRMYIIGHPGGRDLEFSLDDNRLIACNAQKLHYRTPTEGGSSGSPIFDPVGWQVVGLHHAGKGNMPKLNGPVGEFYEANEGIAILAIRQKTAVS